MRAGLLARSRITIQRATASQNSYGEDVPTWAAIGSCWANIRPLQGRELEAAQQTFAEARFRIEVRYQRGAGFQRKDRVIWGSRTLDILDVEDPDQRQRRLFLTCKEYAS